MAVAYATSDDVRSAVARDPDKTAGTAASMEDVELDLAVRNAQAEVDARLRGRYTVPLAPCPELVRNIVIDVAAYLATLVYRQGKDLSAFDPVVLRYDRAQKLLKQIADGLADLDLGDGGAVAPDTAGGVGAPINPRGTGLLTAGFNIRYPTGFPDSFGYPADRGPWNGWGY